MFVINCFLQVWKHVYNIRRGKGFHKAHKAQHLHECLKPTILYSWSAALENKAEALPNNNYNWKLVSRCLLIQFKTRVVADLTHCATPQFVHSTTQKLRTPPSSPSTPSPHPPSTSASPQRIWSSSWWTVELREEANLSGSGRSVGRARRLFCFLHFFFCYLASRRGP